MNKQDLIKAVARDSHLSLQQAQRAIDSTFGIIGKALEEKQEVAIADFGKFSVRTIPQRQGINPLSKEKITIPEHDRIHFKAYGKIHQYHFKYSNQ